MRRWSRCTGIAAQRPRQLVQFVMPGLVPGIHVLKTASTKDVDGRDKPGHDGETAGSAASPMSLFAKISTYDERSARLAGIGLMLLSIFMFSFGDALGKYHGRDLFGRAIAVAARLRGVAGAAADDLEAARRIHAYRTAVAAAASRDCSRRSKSPPSFSPPSICRSPTSSPIIWPRRSSSPRCRASCSASASAGGAGPRS